MDIDASVDMYMDGSGGEMVGLLTSSSARSCHDLLTSSLLAPVRVRARWR